MPYLASNRTVAPYRVRRARRGLGSLGDCQPYATWTSEIQSNVPLAQVFDANCPLGVNGVLTPCAIQAQQMSTAIQDIQSQMGDCVPSGTQISVTLNGQGQASDTPAYSITPSGGPTYSTPALTGAASANFVPPPLTSGAAGMIAAAVAMANAANNPVTPGAAAIAANPMASIPTAFAPAQPNPLGSTTPKEPVAAAANGTVVPATAQTQIAQVSSGVPEWVFLAAGAAVLIMIFMGGKSK
jgi:hypothetical protein